MTRRWFAAITGASMSAPLVYAAHKIKNEDFRCYSGLVKGVVKELNSAQPFPQRTAAQNRYR